MTYIGALLTNPPLRTRQCAPRYSSLFATSIHSLTPSPPLKPSEVFVFTITAILSEAASITSFMHMSMNFILLENEPPYWSRLWLVYGERNCEMRYPCPA